MWRVTRIQVKIAPARVLIVKIDVLVVFREVSLMPVAAHTDLDVVHRRLISFDKCNKQ
jgi:hypothetical protein